MQLPRTLEGIADFYGLKLNVEERCVEDDFWSFLSGLFSKKQRKETEYVAYFTCFYLTSWGVTGPIESGATPEEALRNLSDVIHLYTLHNPSKRQTTMRFPRMENLK